MANRFTMPIVSLVTEPSNFFNADTGIYVKGVNYDTGNPTWTGNYFMTGIEWERDVYIQYFDIEGNLVICQDAGVRIHGGRQRAAAQKTLRLYARSEYGENKFNYQLLPQKSKSEFKRFLLKTSYGCWNSTVIKDPMASSLVRDLKVEMQDYRPVIVLLNGNYWGIQTVRDYMSVYHYADKYNIPYDGTTVDYVNFYNFVDTADVTDSANYEFIKSKLDICNYLSYQNTEIYLNNYDWPGSNTRYWYSNEYDGKFRWFLYDLDASFNHTHGGTDHNLLHQAIVSSSGWPNPAWSTLVLSTLLENDEFKNDFIARAAYLMNYYFDEDTIIPVINNFKALYGPEYQEHAGRWNTLSYSSWTSAINSTLTSFAGQRRSYVEQHFISKFDLEGTSQLTISVNDSEAGEVYLCNLPVPNENSTARYFNDVNHRLCAVPKYGYRFKHWVNVEDSLNAEIFLHLVSDSTVFALFEEDTVPQLYINEIISKNSIDTTDNYLEHEDWIEIYNDSDSIVDLAGLFLSDDTNFPFKWEVPNTQSDSTTLDPYEFIIFFADISYGRYPDGDSLFSPFLNTTPENPNVLSDSTTNVLSGLFINELLASNIYDTTDVYFEHEDWIEIYNNNDTAINLGGLFLSDDPTLPFKWQIPTSQPDSTTIDPYGFIIFFADDSTEQGVRHTNFKLSSLGESVFLVQEICGFPVIIDSLSAPILSVNVSYGRYPDGDSLLVMLENTTPERSNIYNSLVESIPITVAGNITVVPNPFSQYTSILIADKFKNPFTIEIYNSTGNLALKMNDVSENTIRLNKGNLMSGLYHIIVYDKKQIIGKSKIIILYSY